MDAIIENELEQIFTKRFRPLVCTLKSRKKQVQ